MADPVDELYNDQLEDIPEVLYLLHAGGEVGQRSVLVRVDQHHERVPLRQGSKTSFLLIMCLVYHYRSICKGPVPVP
jgi:hypothetical protein